MAVNVWPIFGYHWTDAESSVLERTKAGSLGSFRPTSSSNLSNGTAPLVGNLIGTAADDSSSKLGTCIDWADTSPVSLRKEENGTNRTLSATSKTSAISSNV